jgi:O-antigen ligase
MTQTIKNLWKDSNNVELLFFGIFLLTLPLNRQHVFSVFHETFDLNHLSLYASDLTLFLWLGYGSLKYKYEHKLAWLSTFGLSLILGTVFILSPRETYAAYFTLKALEMAFLFLYFRIVSRDDSPQINYTSVLVPIMTILGVFESFLALAQFLVKHSWGLKLLGEPVISSFIDGIAKLDVRSIKYIRGYGTFPHPNPLAAFLIVACATAIYGYLTSKTFKIKKLYLFSTICITWGVFITFSRAGIGVLCLTTGFIILLSYKSHPTLRKSLKRLGISLIFVYILALLILNPFLRARNYQNTPTSFTRSYYNRLGLEIVKEHPLGVGIGNVLPFMAEKVKPTANWQVQPPHNYFIVVACETGILGLLLIIAVFYLAGRRLIKEALSKTNPQEEKLWAIILLSSLGSIIILMFFDHYFYTVQQTQLLLWLIIGLIFKRRFS